MGSGIAASGLKVRVGVTPDDTLLEPDYPAKERTIKQTGKGIAVVRDTSQVAFLSVRRFSD